jgi:phage terminase large subunit
VALRSAPPSPAYLPAADVAERLFGVDMWGTPREILASVFSPRSRTAVKACHASSKTHSAAIAIALALYEGGDVLTTAPTWEQVKTVLWGEVHRLLAGSVIPLSEWGSINQTEIIMPDGSHALGLSTNEGVRFQGWHARPGSFLLLIGDEAPGVRPDIFEAWEGISAGGDVRHLLLGNPVIASGYFYDIFAGAAPNWRRFTIDAFDTPNLDGLDLPGLLALPERDLSVSTRPYLVTRQWVRDRYDEWGVDHPLWQSRVRGQFPLQSDDALLSLAWLEAASRKPAAYTDDIPVQAGVDVAGPGEDETTLCVRQGDAILELRAWPHADSRGEVIAALAPWRERGLDAVNVDVAGLGHYFALALEDEGLPIVRVNVGEAPFGRSERDQEQARAKFLNLRAQVFWSFREWAEAGMLAGLTDQTAIAQLAGIRYEHDGRGRIKIESKDDARKRGVKSPDRAEAIVLAFWSGMQRPTLTIPASRPIVRNGTLDASRYEAFRAKQARSEARSGTALDRLKQQMGRR